MMTMIVADGNHPCPEIRREEALEVMHRTQTGDILRCSSDYPREAESSESKVVTQSAPSRSLESLISLVLSSSEAELGRERERERMKVTYGTESDKCQFVLGRFTVFRFIRHR